MSNISTMHNISGKISQTEKGAPNGVPVLDESGDVPVTQLNITKSDVGLSNVDNTSDANKPVSTATQTALNAKANSADAVSTNTANKIVLRDGSGNFSAGSITAGLSGNASTASTLATARTLTVGNTGKNFDGSANVAWSLSEIGAWGASNDGSGSGLDADLLDGLHSSSFGRVIADVTTTSTTDVLQISNLNVGLSSILEVFYVSSAGYPLVTINEQTSTNGGVTWCNYALKITGTNLSTTSMHHYINAAPTGFHLSYVAGAIASRIFIYVDGSGTLRTQTSSRTFTGISTSMVYEGCGLASSTISSLSSIEFTMTGTPVGTRVVVRRIA